MEKRIIFSLSSLRKIITLPVNQSIFLTLIFVATLLQSWVVDESLAQQRRPIDSQHPLWLIHIDVWNNADPQKIIDLIPATIKPYVCMNLSLSCQYDTDKNIYKMPQNAVRTYKSWASVCQANNMWFTCQPASGGHTHIQDDDIEIFEYFFKKYPNFLGWNYAEQFWGFDEPGDKSSSSQADRLALFAKLVPMAHKYGGFLTVSFCGNIWSHPLNPVGMMKRNADLLSACKQYPEAILWLYKYTTSSCFYNNESVTISPFISGLAKNYGVRYDNCGWNGALDALLGDNHGKKYPVAAGIGTVMEQSCVNGGAVWDGPELIWTEDFKESGTTTVSGYTHRNWTTYPGFNNAWCDMFQKIIDGELYIPTRQEVVGRTKVAVHNNLSSGSDEDKYAAWGSLYDGLYKQNDPFNKGTGQWMDNYCYFKKTGRYAAIPVCLTFYDSLAQSIPVKVSKSNYSTRWSTQTKKIADFNAQYPEVSTGDMYVSRFLNQLTTYTPYTYLNSNRTSSAEIPLLYNTCDTLSLTWGLLSSASIHEYSDHIDFYLNNYRTDTTTLVLDEIKILGATSEPTYTMTKRVQAQANASAAWDEQTGTYTLSIKHNGPVDITINCSGSNTREQLALVNNLPLSEVAGSPAAPADYYGPLIVEAEDMDYKNISRCVTNYYNFGYQTVRGHSGNGFADMGSSTSGGLRHTPYIKTAGDYKISVRYTNTNKSGYVFLIVNGIKKSVVFSKTEKNEWKKATITSYLQEGTNTFVLSNSNGLAMYVDNVTYTPADLPEERFAVTVRDGGHGTVTLSTDSAAEGETVFLDVTPDEGYALDGWQVVHGGITVAADNSFTMPDDIVTLQPIYKDITSIYKLDYTDVLSGTLPQGWRAVQENSDTHSYPNSYSSGGRVFTGFTGWQGKALYWREDCADYGRLTDYPLTLSRGWYKLSFVTAAWKGTPKYKAQILNLATGTVVKESAVYTAQPNANGNTSADISSAKMYSITFQIESEGNYVISFVNAENGGGFEEFLLAECSLNTTSDPSGIEDIYEGRGVGSQINSNLYNLSGLRVDETYRGIVIRRGEKYVNK